VRLGHIFAAVGLNVLRLGEWFLETARAKTRITPFARLMAEPPAAQSVVTSPSVAQEQVLTTVDEKKLCCFHESIKSV
jgi:hypothetical protein